MQSGQTFDFLIITPARLPFHTANFDLFPHTFAPQLAQNLLPGFSFAPQFVQNSGAFLAPHSPQKRLPGSNGAPQFLQNAAETSVLL